MSKTDKGLLSGIKKEISDKKQWKNRKWGYIGNFQRRNLVG